MLADMMPRIFSISRLFLVLFSIVAFSCTNPSTRSIKDKSNAATRSSGHVKQISPATDSAAPVELPSTSRISWPKGMRRLVMLPIYSVRPIGEAQRDMDGIFRAELSKVVKYEIVQVPRQDMENLFRRDSFSSSEVIPPELIRVLLQKYAADAVLFTDFTLFRPYRPLAIGVRTKIVDLKTMDVIWMADGILDSAEPDVANSAMHFAERGLRMSYVSPTIPKGREREQASGNQIILQSPRLYAGYTAHEAFASLAPLPPPMLLPSR